MQPGRGGRGNTGGRPQPRWAEPPNFRVGNGLHVTHAECRAQPEPRPGEPFPSIPTPSSSTALQAVPSQCSKPSVPLSAKTLQENAPEQREGEGPAGAAPLGSPLAGRGGPSV